MPVSSQGPKDNFPKILRGFCISLLNSHLLADVQNLYSDPTGRDLQVSKWGLQIQCKGYRPAKYDSSVIYSLA